MRPVLTLSQSQESPEEDRSVIAMRVADALADAVSHGPFAALRTARSLSDQELRLGLDFVSVVLEVASGSARAMAAVLAERSEEQGAAGVH
ncbi:MAG TPA: hypothetical protein VG692_17515 [Gemmatimonadales bacterium]|nr:hypothetical protein [Gemmatimonadales bacterium]